MPYFTCWKITANHFINLAKISSNQGKKTHQNLVLGFFHVEGTTNQTCYAASVSHQNSTLTSYLINEKMKC